MADIFNAFNSNAAVGATSNAGEPPAAINTTFGLGVAEAAEHPAGALRQIRRAALVLRGVLRGVATVQGSGFCVLGLVRF